MADSPTYTLPSSLRGGLGRIGSLRLWGILQEGVRRLACLRECVPLGAALLVFIGLSVWAMAGESVTYDEGAHLAAGATYVRLVDFRLMPEHPPLAKTLPALCLVPLKVHLPLGQESWKNGYEWPFAYQFLYQSGNDSRRILFVGRLPSLFFTCLLIGGIFAVSRELWGPAGGLVSLVLSASCPLLLAHGHLVTTDATVSCLLFLSMIAVWKMAQTARFRWSLYSGILLGGALGAKFSALVFAPALLGVFAALSLRYRSPAPKKSVFDSPAGRVILAGTVAVLSVAVVWGLYGFRYRAVEEGPFEFSWESPHSDHTLLRWVIEAARRGRWLPEAYLNGVAHVHEDNQGGHPAYALGHVSHEGWWWYFPFAFLVKSSTGLLLILVCTATVWIRLKRWQEPELLFLVAPVLVFLAATMTSRINIGVRHLLPLYPPLYVLGGILGTDAAAPVTGPRLGVFRRWGIAFLLLLVPAESLTEAPYFLAFFNLPSRLCWERSQMLVDSNLDWGQDLGRLKAYLNRHGIRHVKLAYFGAGSPRALGLDHEILPGVTSYTQYVAYEPEWHAATPLEVGDWVAISATYLRGDVLEDPGYFARAFAGLRPEALIGHSIYLYHLSSRPAGW